MKYTARLEERDKLPRIDTPCLVVGVFESGQPGAVAAEVDQVSGQFLTRVLAREDLQGKLGESQLLPDVSGVTAARVLLLGLGQRESFDANAIQKATRTLVSALDATAADKATLTFLEEAEGTDLALGTRFLVLAAEQHSYSFDELKSEKNEAIRLKELELLVGSAAALDRVNLGLRQGTAIADGISLARTLGDRPGNLCTPTHLANQARRLDSDFERISTSILDEEEMRALGMGALLAVSQGSAEPARLIVMEYRNGDPEQQPLVLVGKGISFDTGGISMKPAVGMGEMKYDMCGAASVFGTLHAAAAMQLPINLIGVVASAENMPSGTAIKPGDIVTSLSGLTIEINNTDAEGRLVLCDALTYIERFKPETVIDIATLTGACVIALGHHATGLMTNDDSLAADLLAAGETAHDRVWRLPLWNEYQKQLYSNHADMSNIGGRPAGTITAGCFLSRFTNEYRWAHLDIAGTGYASGQKKHATGRPVSLLTQYLLDRL